MGVVEEINAVATTLGYEFIYGTFEYVNVELTELNLQAKSAIYITPIQNVGSYINGTLDKTTYNTIIGLTVKKYDGMQATTDETFKQKHDRRLKDMEALLLIFIKTLGCVEDFEILTHRIYPEVNKKDENVDEMMGEIQFVYG